MFRHIFDNDKLAKEAESTTTRGIRLESSQTSPLIVSKAYDTIALHTNKVRKPPLARRNHFIDIGFHLVVNLALGR